jgi:hypothetical protein
MPRRSPLEFDSTYTLHESPRGAFHPHPRARSAGGAAPAPGLKGANHSTAAQEFDLESRHDKTSHDSPAKIDPSHSAMTNPVI